MTTERNEVTPPLDELLVGAEPITRAWNGDREPTSTEIRRTRHWIAQGIIRTHKRGALHTTTRRRVREDLALDDAPAVAA